VTIQPVDRGGVHLYQDLVALWRGPVHVGYVQDIRRPIPLVYDSLHDLRTFPTSEYKGPELVA
jgi:hypothetical protein